MTAVAVVEAAWSGATEITSATTQSNQTYFYTTDAECAVLVSLASGTVNLVNPIITKSSGLTNAGDNYNFYGINSGIMAMGGGYHRFRRDAYFKPFRRRLH